MDASDLGDVIVKKEPCDNVSDDADNNADNRQTSSVINDSTAPTATGPLRYVSRRGRPPGGGYSMKSHSQYVSFNSAPLTASTDLSRQTSLGSNSSLSPQDLLKTGAPSSSDGLDIRRFGFQGFDTDKSAFRCDGCDVIFSSRDTYAMHMLLRAKNESCVALPTSAISSNPENPTPREKFERELRQQAMITALRNQAAAMSKAAAAMMPKASTGLESLSPINRLTSSSRDDIAVAGGNAADGTFNFSSLFSVDAYGLYVDPRQYRRFLEEYGLRTSASTGSLANMMEQLSCSVCGELFSNKDALAMHMMFHTREEEKDTKPPINWPDGRSAVASALSSPSFSMASSAENKETSKTDSSRSRKRETQKGEERELTAERVAELKRMAIESSLRSPPKKQSSSPRQSARPKSVSQDTAVTSTAQSRPLSADDAMRLTKSGPKGVASGHSPVFSSNRDHYETIFYKRRRFATADDNSVLEVRQMSDPLKHKRMRYDGSLYDLFYRNNKNALVPPAQDGETDPKVCDNHVSSASGPQDSDDTSEGSSVPELDPKTAKADIGQRSDYSKVRDIPYLDAIMSQDAVLIPLGTPDRESDRHKFTEERSRRNDNARMMQSSALDFSIGSREPRENTFSMSSWYNADPGRDGASSETHSSPPSLNINKTFDRADYRRGTFSQYPGLAIGSMGRLEGRGHPISSGSLQDVRHDNSATDQDTMGTPRNPAVDSPSRVGEARYCPHCEILFLDVTLFHLHMGLHNVNNPWQCNTCGLVCSGRLEFNTHVLHY